jgi:hypothetical protein
MSIQNYYGANCSSSIELPVPFTDLPCSLSLVAINPECQGLVNDTLEGFCKDPLVEHVSDPCDDCFSARLHICSSLHPNVSLCGKTVFIPCSSKGYADLLKRWEATSSSTSWCGLATKITALGLLLLLGTGAIARLFIK